MADAGGRIAFERPMDLDAYEKYEQEHIKLKELLKEKYPGIEEKFGETTIRAFCVGYRTYKQEEFLNDVKNALKYRDDEGYPDLLSNPIQDSFTRNSSASCIYNVDKCGRPVFYVDCPKVNTSDSKAQEAIGKMMAHIFFHLRAIQEHNAKLSGRPDSMWTSVVVLNMEGVGLWAAKNLSGLLNIIINTGSTMFGLASHRTYLINCGWSIHLILGIVKPFMYAETKEKVENYGTGYIKHLTKDIPIENIPRKFGGTCDKEMVFGDIILPENLGYPHKQLLKGEPKDFQITLSISFTKFRTRFREMYLTPVHVDSGDIWIYDNEDGIVPYLQAPSTLFETTEEASEFPQCLILKFCDGAVQDGYVHGSHRAISTALYKELFQQRKEPKRLQDQFIPIFPGLM